MAGVGPFRRAFGHLNGAIVDANQSGVVNEIPEQPRMPSIHRVVREIMPGTPWDRGRHRPVSDSIEIAFLPARLPERRLRP